MSWLIVRFGVIGWKRLPNYDAAKEAALSMTDREILDWLDEQGVLEILLGNGKTIDLFDSGCPIRAAIIQARDNQNEAAGVRHYEGLRG